MYCFSKGTPKCTRFETGKTTFSQCDDDAQIFTLDTSATKNSPDPITKGGHVKFKIAGIVDDEMEVHNIHVHCDWNKSTLYD